MTSMGCVYNLFHIAEYEEEWSWLWKPNTGYRVSEVVTVHQVYWTQASNLQDFGVIWGHPKQTVNTALNRNAKIEMQYFAIHLKGVANQDADWTGFRHRWGRELSMLVHGMLLTSIPAPAWDAGDWMLVTSFTSKTMLVGQYYKCDLTGGPVSLCWSTSS